MGWIGRLRIYELRGKSCVGNKRRNSYGKFHFGKNRRGKDGHEKFHVERIDGKELPISDGEAAVNSRLEGSDDDPDLRATLEHTG